MARIRRPREKDEVDNLVVEMEKTLDESKQERQKAEKAIQILEARAKAMLAAYWEKR